MISYNDIKSSPEIRSYIEGADASLKALGYTDHSYAHVARCAEVAADILSKTGSSEREVELAKIAGFLHDIGNVINRVDHSQSGAIMAFRILDKMGMPSEEIVRVISAIGNHDEGTGVPVNEISAAIIIADKSDVRRTRVRNPDPATFDIHDRVNYSVVESSLTVSEGGDEICLSLTIDTKISSIMDYFEIFLERMSLCRRAAQRLGAVFKLKINSQQFI